MITLTRPVISDHLERTFEGKYRMLRQDHGIVVTDHLADFLVAVLPADLVQWPWVSAPVAMPATCRDS